MVGVPQLRCNKNIFARDPIRGKSCLQRLAYLALVPVSLSAVEVSKSGVHCASGRSFRHGGVGNKGAKAECGHVAGSVVEWHCRHPKIRRFQHGYPTKPFCVWMIVVA